MTNQNGYGMIYEGGKGSRPILMHRLSWEHHVGPIPKGLLVLHRCDNPPCFNPNHLFLGTQADNMADMDAKGRRHKGPVDTTNLHRGEQASWAKLTEAQVREIRARYVPRKVTQDYLASEYGVSRRTIGMIIDRVNWKHID